jgi:hypothetical protein
MEGLGGGKAQGVAKQIIQMLVSTEKDFCPVEVKLFGRGSHQDAKDGDDDGHRAVKPVLEPEMAKMFSGLCYNFRRFLANFLQKYCFLMKKTMSWSISP